MKVRVNDDLEIKKKQKHDKDKEQKCRSVITFNVTYYTKRNKTQPLQKKEPKTICDNKQENLISKTERQTPGKTRDIFRITLNYLGCHYYYKMARYKFAAKIYLIQTQRKTYKMLSINKQAVRNDEES